MYGVMARIFQPIGKMSSMKKTSINKTRQQKIADDQARDLSDYPHDPDNDANVTKEDLENLGDVYGDQDMGEDESTGNARVDELDNQEGLDIPGAELDNEGEEIGAEDEENNYYSLGGERHEDLENDEP